MPRYRSRSYPNIVVSRDDDRLDHVARWVRLDDDGNAVDGSDGPTVVERIDPDEPSTEALAQLAEPQLAASPNVSGAPDAGGEPVPFRKPTDEASTESLEALAAPYEDAPVNFAGDPAEGSQPEPRRTPVDSSVAEERGLRSAYEASPGWYKIDGDPSGKSYRLSQLPDGVEVFEPEDE